MFHRLRRGRPVKGGNGGVHRGADRRMTRILRPTGEALREAASVLLDGGVVAIPTETVYGLAGHLFDEGALVRIFEAKERPTFDPLIVHVASFPWPGLVDWSRLDEAATAMVHRLAERFWPGPLTLVLPKDPRVPDLATSGLDTVGIRVPAHPVALALLEEVGVPLAAPSANRFGRISPTRAEHVAEELGDRIPLVLDGGPTPVGVESTIVAVGKAGRLTLLRPGGISLEALESAVGARVDVAAPARDGPHPGPRAPGMLESHYAPGKPVVLLPAPLDTLPEAMLAASLALGRHRGPPALLLQEGGSDRIAGAKTRTGATEARALSDAGEAADAARNLFATLRELDASPLTAWILAEPAAGSSGLGYAINDRLRRAAAPRPRAPGAGEPPGSGRG
jgi:L-threonylcarbamoyladenylate synthase